MPGSPDGTSPEDQPAVSLPPVPLPPSPPPPLPLPPLPYADPGIYQRPKPRTPYIGRLSIGCFGYVLLSGGWLALGSIGHNLGTVAFVGWMAMTAALLGMSLYLRIRYGFSGVGVGILAGIGVAIAITALLAIGVVMLVMSICGKRINSGSGPSASPVIPAPYSQPATGPGAP